MARKAHVKRVYQMTKNADGTTTKDESMWVDMLRIDGTVFKFKTVPDGSASRGARYRFNWNDTDEENKAPFRQTQQRKVKNANDESQTIDVWIVDRTRMTHKGGLQPGDGTGGNAQFLQWRFNNPPQGGTRKTTAVRVINNDLDGLDMSKGPVSWETYSKALKKGNTDDSQAIDVQVVDNFLIRFGADAVLPQTSTKNKLRYGLANKAIESMFKRSPGNAKPTRFDPLQVPVNCSFVSEMVMIYGGPSDDGVTLACLKIKDGKVAVVWQKTPFSGGGTDQDTGIPYLNETNVYRIDQAGNVAVSCRGTNLPDKFYDTNGKEIGGMPTLKPTKPSKSTRPTKDTPIVASKCYNRDSYTTPDPNDSRTASFVKDNAGFAGGFLDGSFLIQTTLGGRDASGLSPIPLTSPGLGKPNILQGTAPVTNKITITKYDKKGNQLWERVGEDLSRTEHWGNPIELHGTLGFPPDEKHVLVPWYADYFPFGFGFDYAYASWGKYPATDFGGVECLGKFTLWIRRSGIGHGARIKTMHVTWDEGWGVTGSSDVTYYADVQTTWSIEVINDSGAVVKTIPWGTGLGGFTSGLPIDWAGWVYHEPFPTDDTPGGAGGVVYSNSYASLRAK